MLAPNRSTQFYQRNEVNSGKFGFTLAEVFSPHCAGSRKFGFTLAEVLITLGIIGVVAAMTMPSLIASYQKQELVTRLKKEVNVLENGIRRILADEGVERIRDSSLWQENSEGGTINAENFKNLFKVSYMPNDSKTNHFLERFSDSSKAMYFNDGSCVAFGSYMAAGNIFLDTNCDKGPNKWGFDRFIGYHLTNSPWEKMYKENQLINNIYFENAEEAENMRDAIKSYAQSDDYKNANDEQKQYVDTLMGQTALKLIIYDGWQMKY